MNKLIIAGLLLLSLSQLNAQLLKTTQTINVSGGIGHLNGNSDNLFFPTEASQSLSNVGISYERNILNWLSAGAVVDYTNLSAPSSSATFAQVVANDETILSVGPLASFHTSYKSVGVFNWLKAGIAIAPKYYQYSGNRKLLIDNEVIPSDAVPIATPELEMNNSTSGFSLQLRPQLYYRITQRFGLSMAYNINVLRLNTGYENEPLSTSYFSAGILVSFGREKQIFN